MPIAWAAKQRKACGTVSIGRPSVWAAWGGRTEDTPWPPTDPQSAVQLVADLATVIILISRDLWCVRRAGQRI
jgi:hypothetical protein